MCYAAKATSFLHAEHAASSVNAARLQNAKHGIMRTFVAAVRAGCGRMLLCLRWCCAPPSELAEPTIAHIVVDILTGRQGPIQSKY
jgi:hypothetical protein